MGSIHHHRSPPRGLLVPATSIEAALLRNPRSRSNVEPYTQTEATPWVAYFVVVVTTNGISAVISHYLSQKLKTTMEESQINEDDKD